MNARSEGRIILCVGTKPPRRVIPLPTYLQEREICSFKDLEAVVFMSGYGLCMGGLTSRLVIHTQSFNTVYSIFSLGGNLDGSPGKQLTPTKGGRKPVELHHHHIQPQLPVLNKSFSFTRLDTKRIHMNILF
jgi:hypothetical protein